MGLSLSKPSPPPYNGILDGGELQYGGHKITLRLPKEVWRCIEDYGGADFLWCGGDDWDFFELLYPGWLVYIREQAQVQYNLQVFQTSVFGEGLLSARETKDSVPPELSRIWG